MEVITNDQDLIDIIRTAQISIRDGLAYRTVGHNTFGSDIKTYKFFHMKGSGSIIWELIDGKRTGDEIAHLAAMRFDADVETVRKDVVSFLGQLAKQSLVKLPFNYRLEQKPEKGRLSFSDHKIIGGLEFAAYASQNLIPLDVFMTLTTHCNARCYYCYNINRDPKNKWGDNGFFNILDELASLGTLRLNLTGGEPMIHPGFFDILDRAHKLNFCIRISTNGTMIDEKAAERIAQAQPYLVAITFHASTPELHEALNQLPGSFERSLRAVAALRERGVRTEMVFVLSKYNVKDVAYDMALARSLDANFKISADVKPRATGEQDTLPWNMSAGDLEWLISEGYYVPHADRCFAGSQKAVIHPDGKVYPCEWVPVMLGDLNNQSFNELWHDQPANKIRNEGWFEPPEDCKNCSCFTYCARCPGRAMIEDGDIHAPSSFACYMANTYQRVLTQKTAAEEMIKPRFQR